MERRLHNMRQLIYHKIILCAETKKVNLGHHY